EWKADVPSPGGGTKAKGKKTPYYVTGPEGMLFGCRAVVLGPRQAFSHDDYHRCIIPLDGYYEWKADVPSPGGGTKAKGKKTPYYVTGPEGMLF
ncbi:SOS response-associated peptidase family protein, partial [Bacteroides fragilis]|nr:SOS response-associated peptidase family protein [Bacteroides fragilis]